MNTDANIQKALESVVLYRVDAEKGEGKVLAGEFKVKNYPSFIMVNKDGNAIDRWIGYSSSFFINTLGDALIDLSTIDEKKTRFNSMPDLRASVVLGRYSSSMGDYKEAVGYYLQAQVLKTDPNVNYLYNVFDNMSRGVEKEIFTYEDAVKAADAALATGENHFEDAADIAETMSRMAADYKHPDDIAKYLQAGLNATAGSDKPDMKKAYARLMVNFCLQVKGDTASAVEYKRLTLVDGWTESASDLNNFAWWCFENNTNLEEAEQLSRKSVDLAKPGKEKAMNYDTLAEILNARGDIKEAIGLSKKACAEEPTSDYYPKQVERFQKALAETN